MTHRGEPPLARLTAVFAIVVAMAACTETAPAPAPDPVPAPAPAPAPPAPAPSPGPVDALPPAVAATRDAILAAAQADDWDAIAALIPAEDFSSNFGGEEDHVAFYRSLDQDVLAVIVGLLEGPFGTVGTDTVWPDLHARDPFVITDEERPALEERYGADFLANWEAAGSYMGWRLGIGEDGAWKFLVAGD
jgi:hypothetical protein